MNGQILKIRPRYRNQKAILVSRGITLASSPTGQTSKSSKIFECTSIKNVMIVFKVTEETTE